MNERRRQGIWVAKGRAPEGIRPRYGFGRRLPKYLAEGVAPRGMERPPPKQRMHDPPAFLIADEKVDTAALRT